CSLNGGCMALRLCDVQCDPIADRALKELAHRYTVAEEKSCLFLTEKAGNMKLLLNDLDDLHQWDFSHHQEMVKGNELLRQQRERVSKRLFETRFSRKSGARLSALIKASRPPAPRRGDHLR